MSYLSRSISYILLMLLLHTDGYGQLITLKHISPDSNYIADYYRRHLVVRIYGSNKYNIYKFIDHGDPLAYKPNSPNNIGVGINYKFLGLNLGFNMPFLNKDEKNYGETRYLDLQTHLYMNRYIVDFYGQFYRGYYLSNPIDALGYTPPVITYPQRPDIHTRNIGIFGNYVLNNKRFSFNAPFYQNEYQKKSAGSLILGAGAYYTDLRGVAPIIPSNTVQPDFYGNNDFNYIRNTGLSFSIGYGYTLIIKKHFFLTASPNIGTGLNYVRLTNYTTGTDDDKIGSQYNLTFRAAAGYNSERYFAGINFVHQLTGNAAPGVATWYEVSAGNARIIIAKRFVMKRKIFIDKQKIIEVQ